MLANAIEASPVFLPVLAAATQGTTTKISLVSAWSEADTRKYSSAAALEEN